MAKPDLSNAELARLFVEQFPRVDSLAVQIIWRWRREGDDEAFPDETVDLMLRHLLREAKYLP